MKDRVQQTPELRPGLLDKCVHVSGKGFGLPGFCLRNRECWHCAFDEWIELIEGDDQRVLARAA
jgi:hypothetical protein